MGDATGLTAGWATATGNSAVLAAEGRRTWKVP